MTNRVQVQFLFQMLPDYIGYAVRVVGQSAHFDVHFDIVGRFILAGEIQVLFPRLVPVDLGSIFGAERLRFAEVVSSFSPQIDSYSAPTRTCPDVSL